MSAISNLFENLMTYNDVNATEKRTKRVIKENDSTLLNLTVELPTDTEEITPEDVKVDVGVMTVDTEGVPKDEENSEKVEEPEEGGEPIDVTPESEESEENGEISDEEPEKEESLDLTHEATKICTGEKDCDCETCKIKKENENKVEANDFDTAVANIRKRVIANENNDVKVEGIFKKDIHVLCIKMKDGNWDPRFWSTDLKKVKEKQKELQQDSHYDGVEYKICNRKEAQKYDKGFEKSTGNLDESYCRKINEGIFKKNKKQKNNSEEKTELIKVCDLKTGNYVKVGNQKLQIKNIKVVDDGLGREGLKDYMITYSNGETDRLPQNNKVNMYTESLMHLDTKSLNMLFTQFVKDNYKNIDKVVISKAVLENKMLKLEGKIYDINGEFKKVSFTNRGFDAAKLENKRFVMDFKDNLGTFGVIKESVKKPFVFTAILKEGVLSFENLKYLYKTRIDESRIAEVSGKCVLNEGLFDGAVKKFVKRQMDAFDTVGRKIIPADDGLAFTIEFKGEDEKEKLTNDLKRHGYEGELGVYELEKDKQKIRASIKQSNDVNSSNPEYTAKFTARKKDLK